MRTITTFAPDTPQAQVVITTDQDSLGVLRAVKDFLRESPIGTEVRLQHEYHGLDLRITRHPEYNRMVLRDGSGANASHWELERELEAFLAAHLKSQYLLCSGGITSLTPTPDREFSSTDALLDEAYRRLCNQALLVAAYGQGVTAGSNTHAWHVTEGSREIKAAGNEWFMQGLAERCHGVVHRSTFSPPRAHYDTTVPSSVTEIYMRGKVPADAPSVQHGRHALGAA
jgi:hypothetical protein